MRRDPVALPILLTAGLLWACTGPLPVDDPQAALARPAAGPRRHLGAMLALDADPADEDYLEALHQLIWRPGYTTETRERAFERLERQDEAGLKRTIRQQLPRLSARAWQEQLCAMIADRGWTDLSPALVSAWSRRIGFVDDLERAEYQALARMHGPERVTDVVFEIMLEAASPSEIGLRSRSWELLIRLGERARLRALLSERAIDPGDAMLADLAAGVADLGVFPRTREEILWLRKLRGPERAGFYARAVEAVAALDPRIADELELRDLPVLVAVAVHEPSLLKREALHQRVAESLRGVRHHIDPKRFEGFPGAYPQALHEHRDVLTWGDLAAMLMALRAVRVPQVADHLFDYADRDHLDESTEYGGVIALDEKGRFEILEFPPRFRRHDNQFIASQRMLDAAYTALFHFHNHAQRHRNVKHAGPGVGDLNYADSVRANCLVFAFVTPDTLNMDFYRHGRVIVDLGEVVRPASGDPGSR